MGTKYPQVSFVFDRRKTATATSKASVDLRICYNYKQKFIATGIKLNSTQWKNGKIQNCPDILEISQTLDTLLTDVRRIILEMSERGNINIDLIPEILLRKNKESLSFIDFCNMRAEVRKYGKALDSQQRYDRFIKRFCMWGKIREFEDITESSIIMYDTYLNRQGMKPYSKWNNYHRFLNSFILDAIAEGYIQKNPYIWLHIERGKSTNALDKCLTPSEFKILREAELHSPKLERVRDLFIVQTYTCLRYSDLKRFDLSNIIEIEGVKVYKCVQKKTKKFATIPLLPPVLNILNKYNGVLPIISNVKYNLYLKELASVIHLAPNLSTHWARHTGATILLNEGIDMKIVTKICGHSSTKVTEQIYAKLLDETVVNAIQDISGKLI